MRVHLRPISLSTGFGLSFWLAAGAVAAVRSGFWFGVAVPFVLMMIGGVLVSVVFYRPVKKVAEEELGSG